MRFLSPLSRHLLLHRNPKPIPFPLSAPSIFSRLLSSRRDRSDLGFPLGIPSLASTGRLGPLSKSGSLRLCAADPTPTSAGASMTAVVTAAAAAAAAEGSMAARFWIGCSKEAVFVSYTPFVVCLAAGKLGIDAFRSYIAQDVHFLRALAQAYEMAEEYADDDDAKAAINELRKAVLRSLQMHGSVIQEWGIDPMKEVVPNPATLKYIEFLLETASGKIEGGKGPVKIVTPFEKTKIAAYAVGAMTPFMRLDAFLGKELQKHLQDKADDHPYKKWIDTYSSASFEASAVQIEELLDRLSASLTGEELEILEKLYCRAMKFEIEFYSAQSIDLPLVVPFTRLHGPTDHLVIFSDFDLTCSVLDSSAILAEIAILSASRTGQSGTGNLSAQTSVTDLRTSWTALSKQYTDEYEQCIESLLPSEKAKTFDYESLQKNLEQLSDFEKRANSRVIDSGLLKGINLEDIKKAGERMILQDGCKEFFQKVIKVKEDLNSDIHILSYCWCGDLIRSAFSSGCVNDLSIHSNEFNYEESISTGEIVRSMESPMDKANAFRSILANLGSRENHPSVYIGDSVGDLLCLLEADVGIVIGSSTSLRRVGEQFGVSFIPLYPGLIKKQSELTGSHSRVWKGGLSGVLYTASSWTEIHAFLLGA